MPDAAIQTLEHNAGMGIPFGRLVTQNLPTRPTFSMTDKKNNVSKQNVLESSV